MNRKFVNIGACQCEYADPACMLIGLDFTGMLLEGDSDNIEVLNRNYGDKKDFTIISALVDPENVIGYLQTDKSIRQDFDFLKIDIDGIDGPILQPLPFYALLGMFHFRWNFIMLCTSSSSI